MSVGFMTLPAGTRLGRYEILAPIGTGGMGEVYRARDPQLRREVAVKLISASSGYEPDRLSRFKQEALAAAALNHPNVLSVYDVGVQDGAPYLVTELLEGETLRERLLGGPLPLRSALELALPILSGLSAAHEKGIVHRDLKPGNLFVTRDARIKILDFGLAKLTGKPTAAIDVSGEAPTAVHTETGTVVGTAGYMAPEQVRGESADHRADVFAFGAVLYEMVCGRRAFERETAAETMTAILKEDPPLLSEVAPVSPGFARIVRRCLEKKPEERFSSARDLAFALEALGELPGAGAAREPAPIARVSARRRLVTSLLILGAIAAAFVAGRLAVDSDPAETVRVDRLTDAPGLEESPAISPDGRSVAFVASVEGARHLFVRLLAGGTSLQLTRGASEHLFPRWAPDSSSLVYYSPGKESGELGAIWEIPALGGTPRRVASATSGADISPDGHVIAFFRVEGGGLELALVDRDGSNARAIARVEPGYPYFSPRFSPNGKLIAYYRQVAISDFAIFVVPRTGGAPRSVTPYNIEGLTWSHDGRHILFSSARGATVYYLPTHNLWSVRPNGGDLRQLTFGELSYTFPDMNRIGTLVASRARSQSDVWRIPTEGTPVENVARATRVTRQTGAVFTPSVSPDGHELAYLWDSGGHGNIWVLGLESGEARPITFEREPTLQVGLPLWSPDGTQIAYFLRSPETRSYWAVSPDGSNRRPLAPKAGFANWSPDGKWLYYSEPPQNTSLKKVPASGGPAVTVRAERASRPALSPDGKTLYYVVELPILTGGSYYEVHAASPESGASRLLARIPERRLPTWEFQPVLSPDGQSLALALFDDPAVNLWALSTVTGELRPLTDFGRRATSIARRVSWSPDGRSIFAAVAERDADVVLLEGLRAR